MHWPFFRSLLSRALRPRQLATQTARDVATAFDIMRQTGHRSISTVSRYVREAQMFRDALASRLGR